MTNISTFFSRSILSFFTILFLNSSISYAVELDDAVLTVPLTSTKTVTLTAEQVKRGKRLFNSTCSICHTCGITKTNPNVGLDKTQEILLKD